MHVTDFFRSCPDPVSICMYTYTERDVLYRTTCRSCSVCHVCSAETLGHFRAQEVVLTLHWSRMATVIRCSVHVYSLVNPSVLPWKQQSIKAGAGHLQLQENVHRVRTLVQAIL